ncbi:MAG TPA: ubiquinol-cytochrome c reductase iron-sulfur subunit [Geothermobacteraceae bacterium]|nr:ubiquinol-cytochrome c reductase iron-sulfur subunit [Geothermobacteraceae bacterium]
MDQQSVPSPQRRNFLLLMLAGVGSALGAMAAWPLLKFLSPSGSGGGSTQVKIAKEKIPLGGAYFFDYRGRPAVLLEPKPGEYVALTAVCTHLGCIVKWHKDQQKFICPCHGGQFSAEGDVLKGPPPAPLESYQVSLDGDQVVVG